MEGSMIDGLNSWIFKIAGLQTITLLVYYRQFEMYHLLPETAPKAVDLRPGNGIPESWKKQIAQAQKLKHIQQLKTA